MNKITNMRKSFFIGILSILIITSCTNSSDTSNEVIAKKETGNKQRTEPVSGQPKFESSVSVTSLEEQVAYQRSFEATVWAMPALGIYGLRTGFMGALNLNNNDINDNGQ
jgi:hypothetical protein